VRRILTTSLAQPLVVITLTAAFAIAGVLAFRSLPIEAFPELADTQVYVITLYEGQAAEEVERQVTLPIERELNGLPGLARMRSMSIYGLSSITLTVVTEERRLVDAPKRPCATALAPIFTTFSRRVVSDHSAIAPGRARVRRKLARL
jgi:AcrB/AcrD/AcrF family